MPIELVPGNKYYCIPLGETVTFLYYDNGYVVVRDRMERNFWMKAGDLTETNKE